jgi:hypothetical protein
MWSDDYVFPVECNAFPGRVPANGSVFYQRALDDAFSRSIGGLMWPRGFVAAGAYYRFNASLNVSTTVSTRLTHALLHCSHPQVPLQLLTEPSSSPLLTRPLLAGIFRHCTAPRWIARLSYAKWTS